MFYMECDTFAPDSLDRAERNVSINLEGSDDYKDRKVLIEKYLDIIAMESNCDKITREV